MCEPNSWNLLCNPSGALFCPSLYFTSSLAKLSYAELTLVVPTEPSEFILLSLRLKPENSIPLHKLAKMDNPELPNGIVQCDGTEPCDDENDPRDGTAPRDYNEPFDDNEPCDGNHPPDSSEPPDNGKNAALGLSQKALLQLTQK